MAELTNVDAVMVGVLYWPIYLEMQRRRLKVVVKRQVVSQLPEVDFVEVMKKLGLFVPEGSLVTLRNFDEPEELVSRHGNRLWYWVQDLEGTSRLLLVCLVDKQTAKAIELLVMDFEDRWYLQDAALRLNRAMETYSIDVLHRVVQHWVFLHDGLKISAWQPFSEIAKSLKEFLEFLKTSKQQAPSPVDNSGAHIDEAASLAIDAETDPEVAAANEVSEVSADEGIEEALESDEAIEDSDSGFEEDEVVASITEEADSEMVANDLDDEAQSDADDDESAKGVLRPDFSQIVRDDSVDANVAPAVKKRRSAW